MDEERGDADTSLVEVGLSSAQYGALEVESVRMFLCELASECLFIKVFVLCMYFFSLLLFCLPCCKLVCVLKCAGATQLLCQPPCEVNIAALGKQIKEDLARAVKKRRKKGRQPPHRLFFIPHY